jgi:hypothetical protein
MRPVVSHMPTGDVPAFEILLKTGERLIVNLSGEGMGLVAKDIEVFLGQYPALAAMKTEKLQ